jgi:hypothetical protein
MLGHAVTLLTAPTHAPPPRSSRPVTTKNDSDEFLAKMARLMFGRITVKKAAVSYNSICHNSVISLYLAFM